MGCIAARRAASKCGCRQNWPPYKADFFFGVEVPSLTVGVRLAVAECSRRLEALSPDLEMLNAQEF